MTRRHRIALPGQILEEVYRVDLPQQEWQQRVAEEIFGRRDLGTGLLAYEFDASAGDGSVRIGTVAAVGDIEQFARMTEPIHEKPVAKEYSLVVRWGTHSATTRELLASDGSQDPKSSPLIRGIATIGYHDIWAVCSVNPDATGIAFAIPLGKGDARAARALRHQWTRVGVHIAASYRLRERLAGGTGGAPAGLFAPDGRPRHLDEAAVDDREALAHFVKAVDKARARELRGRDEDLLSLWQGLVNGRWSVFDHIDTDGKRFFVVHENDPDARGPKQLSRRETQVASYAAQGHTNKVIAYELGINVATVATHIRNTLAKLGLKRRTDLVWLYGRLVGESPEPNLGD